MADSTSLEKERQDQAVSSGPLQVGSALPHEPGHEQESAQGKEEKPGQEPGQGTGAVADDFEAAMKRAEVVVERAAERVGFYAVKAWRQARRLAARAREEAEDMWVDAQSLRHGKTSDGDD